MKAQTRFSTAIIILLILFLSFFAGMKNAQAQQAKGIYYRVDLGIEVTLENSALEEFSNLDKEVVDGKMTYRTGVYNDYLLAMQRKYELVDKGYKAAEIVAFFNFREVTVEEATALQESFDEMDAMAKASSFQNEPAKTEWKVLTYEIQLDAYSQSSTRGDYAAVGQVKARDNNGLTYYTHGEYNSYKIANAHKNELVSLGYHDAFLVSFLDGKKVMIEEAIIFEAFQSQEVKKEESLAKKE